MRLINRDEIQYYQAPFIEIALKSDIEEITTVPVVLCKNCKWYGDNWVSRMGKLCMNSRLKTGYGTLWVEDDFYCGYGEEHGVE